VKEREPVTFLLNETVEMPDVLGDTEGQARNKLAQAGFQSVEVVQSAPVTIFNVVNDQTPDPETPVCPDTPVRLRIS
jgi:beta-lactam-binding protein with PASTA domain